MLARHLKDQPNRSLTAGLGGAASARPGPSSTNVTQTTTVEKSGVVMHVCTGVLLECGEGAGCSFLLCALVLPSHGIALYPWDSKYSSRVCIGQAWGCRPFLLPTHAH